MYDRANIGRKSRMIQRGSQSLSAATGPHVHPDNVHAGGPHFRAGPNYVLRNARTLKAMDQNHRGVLFPFRLPVAVAQYLHVLLDLDQTLFWMRQAVFAPKKISSKRLGMAIRQKTPRHKRFEN